jgi:two-component system, NtrC family, sensor histidine kinase HydH
MWRQVLLPVILVGALLFAVSAATTYYVQWLDASYQRVLAENVASTSSAALIQEEIWRIQAILTSPESQSTRWSRRLTTFDKEIHDQMAILVNSAESEDERKMTDLIRDLTKQYREQLEPVLRPELRPTNYDEVAAQTQLYSTAQSISDLADRVRYMNEQFMKTASARRQEIRNMVFWSRTTAMFLVPAIGIALGAWTANRLQRSVAQIRVTLHDPSLASPGELGTVQVRGGDELASIQQQVGVVVDRLRRTGDELQAARREVVRSERLAAIGGLAAGVAHELRNPLTSVKLLLQHAASRGGDAVVAAPRMELILDEIERMEATIQGLLDFSRPARPQRQLHDLRQTIERAVNLVEGRAKKQQVTTELSLGLVPVMVNGDPQQLHQVFVNVLINGIEAMPHGGQLTVSLAAAENDKLVVEIEDTGEGIPSELLPRLFEPFATGKDRGTGLGLAVSRRIVEEHGGTVEVCPRLAQGTAFHITLPGVRAVPRLAEPVSNGVA